MLDMSKKNNEKKTIIIMMSTYNGERYLDEQLESIYKQETEAIIKLYIRDDGSSDNTISIIDRWKEQLDIKFFQGANVGPAKGFWEILNLVPLDADYYSFCDQDDVWDIDKLEYAINSVSDDFIPTLYFSNSRLVDENLNSLNCNIFSKKPILTIPSQIVCGTSQGCTMLFNKNALVVIRKAKIQCVAMHDWVIMLHILATGKVIYDPMPRMNYRQHENNVVAESNKNLYKKLKITYRLWVKSSRVNPISITANDLLENYQDVLNSEVRQYLYWLVHYKKNLRYKINLLLDENTTTTAVRSLKSFKIRLFLGFL